MKDVVYKRIDGSLFEKLVASGGAVLKAKKKSVNDLNVFPIPDGDTGDNMYLTLNGGISYLKNEQDSSIGAKAASLAHGMILNARGNSGVILSQFFAGIANGLSGVDEASVRVFAEALMSGVKQAYASVVKPVEGTVLTVAREGSEYALTHLSDEADADELLVNFVEEMKRSLDRTPELLDVLAEAGVVDSGGAGLVAIFEGMLDAVEGREHEDDGEVAGTAVKAVDYSKFGPDSIMEFGYCTEFLLQLQNSKCDIPSFDIQKIIDYLGTIGDSIAAVLTGSIVKIHVHTLTPYKALEFCQQFGEFLTVKIENMTLQHNETDEDFATNRPKAKKPKGKRRSFAVVTVAIGQGLIETFTELGADIVIEGGQGKNPSIERFLEAFDDANADDIFVLPNNSNIIMAARQAADIFEGSKIHIIETKNFGQAYSILSMLDYSSADADEIAASMNEAMLGSLTGMVTSSIRSVTLDGVDVVEGEYIGFTDKTMLVSDPDRRAALMTLADKLEASKKEFLILFTGASVSEQEAELIGEDFARAYPNAEFYHLHGGQEVYDFILILE